MLLRLSCLMAAATDESDGDNFRLPDCNIEAVITGDAVVELNRVGN